LHRLGRLDARWRQALERLSLQSGEALLLHFPRRHEDRSAFLPIASARPGQPLTIAGEIVLTQSRAIRGRRSLFEAEVSDGTGSLSVVWFNQPYLADLIRPGIRIFLHGEVRPAYGKSKRSRGPRLQLVAPEFEVDTGDPGEEEESSREDGGTHRNRAAAPSLHLGRLVPIYPTTRGLGQRTIRRLVHRSIELGLEESFRDGPCASAYPGAVSLGQAIREMHFPPDDEALRRARERLQREEYFHFATRLLRRREMFRETGGPELSIAHELDAKIRSIFPFHFTSDQDRVVAEIAADLLGPRPMYRLLQGDVGSGKTAVALYALLVAVRNRFQGALMAPTEVLAEQHHRTVSRYLAGHPAVRVALLTGGLAPAEKRELHEELANGRCHIAIGTHALIQETVRFHRLGVAVIDEQHRFGVRERSALRKKGDQPHLLVMTATPIPRSLCLTAYGDLDLSVLREKPPGRKPIVTRLVRRRQRPQAMEFIRKELHSGRQAFFIYPLIDDSEALAVPAAVSAHRRLSRDVFPEFSVGLLHGRMEPEEKTERLRRLREGLDQILVATVVVEVGIDVPNATILFLEDASRFGLAQLHQLRGRIGRGPHSSYCFVGVDAGGQELLDRLNAFAATEDGFRIAEEDLRLRGPGDFLGVRQAGWAEFRIGSPFQNPEGFLAVRSTAERFWKVLRNRERFAAWWDREKVEGASGKGESVPGLD